MSGFEALLRRCQAGDAEALEELIRRWELKLFYYVRRLVSHEEDAWDILQQTWMRIVKGIGSVRDAERLAPWMYRVARNVALSHRKSLLAQQRWIDKQASVEELTDIESIDTEWTAADVHRALERLSLHHREALTLFFLQDLSIAEMAGVLGVSEGTVKSRLFYGKQALAEVLEDVRSKQ